MKSLARILTLLALAATSLQAAFAAPTQDQELYALARFDRIIRIDDFDSGGPATPTVITTWSRRQACQEIVDCQPIGLAVDETTGNFFVLVGRWNGGGINASLLSVDRATGNTTVVTSLPYTLVNGLERRWDGKLVTIAEIDKFIVIDPSTGSFTETPLSSRLVGVNLGFGPFNFDVRGDLQVVAGSNMAIESATGGVSLFSSIPSAAQFGGGGITAPFVGGLATANDGEIYLSTIILGNVFRYDVPSGQWAFVYDDGITQEISNIYDLALTNSNFGADFDVVCAGGINSTGERATLTFSGVSSVASQDLTLVTRALPSEAIGMYLMGSAAGSTPLGSGTLCIAPTAYRYRASLSVVSETYAFEIDLSDLPNGQGAMVGEQQIFQFWFRDSTAGVFTSNLSEAISVTFQ